MRKALYPVAHGAVMQAREESEELTDKNRKAEDKVVATYVGGEKSPKTENKARAPVHVFWNQYREVHKRMAEYENIWVRLEHKKRKPQPLTKKRRRKELVSKLPQRAGSWAANGQCVRHVFAALVTRRASEKPTVKNYPKKQGRRSEPEVDVDVCIIDNCDSLALRTLEGVLVSEERREMVSVADRTKT